MSPVQIVFGHPIRSLIPAHHRSYSYEWQQSMETMDRIAAQQRQKAIDRYDVKATGPQK